MDSLVAYLILFIYGNQVCCLPAHPNRRLSLPHFESLSFYDHDYTYFGTQYNACILDSSGLGLPLPGLPSDFTTDLLAKL